MSTAARSISSGSTSDKIQSAATTTNSNTDFDLNKVDINSLSPEAQKFVKGFQADYTKKTQALSKKKEELDNLKKELGEKVKVGEHYSNWYNENKELIDEFNQWLKTKDQDPISNDTGDDVDDDKFLTQAEFRRELKKRDDQLKESQNQIGNAFSQGFKMLVDLASLQSQDHEFKINPEKIIKYARENDITDIGKAFEGAYAEEIVNARIQKAVAEEKEKWEAKHNTNVLSGNQPKGREIRKILPRERK